MNNLHFYFNTIEKAIEKIGLDPQITRQKNPGQWNLRRGQTSVWVDVYFHQKEKRAYFQVAAPVMKLPGANNGKLALELLALNNQLFGVAFCLINENIYIKTTREAEGLDINEAFSMILRVGNYADHYSQLLKQKFPSWEPANFPQTNANLN